MLKSLLSSLIFLFASVTSFSQTTYNGNTKTGFGGAVGTGSLTLTPSGNNISFNFTRGGGLLNDVVVIYIDSKTGGFNSTSTFTDVGDDHRRAISGFNGTDRATLNFPAGFTPDYAIAFNASFGGLWELNATSHNFITTLYPTPGPGNAAANYSFTFDKSQIGITGDIVFNFLATYISATAFRSDEFIGDAGPVSNPGYTSYSATSFESYNSALPVKLLSFGARKNNSDIILNWTTEEETDFKGYRIERSMTGTEFTSVGFINSEGKRNYQFVDRNISGNKIFYRLAMVDIDGREKLSKVIVVKGENGKTSIQNVFPNPVLNLMNLQVIFSERSPIIIQVADANGRVVKVQKEIAEQGSNSFQLNTSDLNKGIYTISIFNNKHTSQLSTTFIKQ